MTTRKTFWAAALAALAALAPACGGPLSVHFRGVMPINENERKESNYVTARIFYLKDDARFNQATVDKLWTEADKVLGDDLVGSKDAKVSPGKADDPYQDVELGQLPDSVRFLGILGMYKKEDDKGSRKIALPKSEAGTVIRFTGYHVEKEK